jgi:hypothetical protein
MKKIIFGVKITVINLVRVAQHIKKFPEYVSPPHLKTETDPVAESLWSVVLLEHLAMEKVQKPSNSKKFPIFHGIWRFITVFTTASNFALLQVMYYHNTYIKIVDTVTAFRFLILKDQKHEFSSRILTEE